MNGPESRSALLVVGVGSAAIRAASQPSSNSSRAEPPLPICGSSMPF